MTYTIENLEGEHQKSLEAFLKALKIPFKKQKAEKPYNPEFVAKIQESRQQYKEGNFVVIKTEDLWK